MSDLIERLRYPAFEHAGTAVMVEAADRIEALEAALWEIEGALGYTKNEGKSPAVRESNAHNAWKIARAALAPERDK